MKFLAVRTTNRGEGDAKSSPALSSAGNGRCRGCQLCVEAEDPATWSLVGMARGPIAFQPPPDDSWGNFGVGIEFAKEEGGFVVKSVEEAEEDANVKVGNVLISVDGVRIESKTQDEVDGMIRGPPGTKVLICLSGDNKDKRYVNLTRLGGHKQEDANEEAGGGGAVAESGGGGERSDVSDAASQRTEQRDQGSQPSKASQEIPKLNFTKIGLSSIPDASPPAARAATNAGMADIDKPPVAGLQDSFQGNKPLGGPSDPPLRTSAVEAARTLDGSRSRESSPRPGSSVSILSPCGRASNTTLPGSSDISDVNRETYSGMQLHQARIGDPVFVEKLVDGAVLHAAIVSSGDELLSVEGRNMHDKTLYQVLSELRAPTPTSKGKDTIMVGFRRRRHGFAQDFWVAIPRQEPPRAVLAGRALSQALHSQVHSSQASSASIYDSDRASRGVAANHYPLVHDIPVADSRQESTRGVPSSESSSLQHSPRTAQYALARDGVPNSRLAEFAEAKWREEGNKAIVRVMEHVTRGDPDRARRDFDKAVIYFQNCRARDMNGELGRLDDRVKELERRRDSGSAIAAVSGYYSPRRREETIVYTPRGVNRVEPPPTYQSPRHSPRGVRSAYETYSSQDNQARNVYHAPYQVQTPRTYQVATPRVVYSTSSPVQQQQVVHGASHMIQPVSTTRNVQQFPYNLYNVA